MFKFTKTVEKQNVRHFLGSYTKFLLAFVTAFACACAFAFAFAFFFLSVRVLLRLRLLDLHGFQLFSMDFL